MNPSRIEQAIDEIYNYVEECKPSKLYPSKVVVDREQLGHEDRRAGILDEEIVVAHVVLADERLDPAEHQPFVRAVVVPVGFREQGHGHDVRALRQHEAVGLHLPAVRDNAKVGGSSAGSTLNRNAGDRRWNRYSPSWGGSSEAPNRGAT